MSESAPIPSRDKFLDANGLVDAVRWLPWFRDLRANVNTGSGLVPGGAVTLANKTTAVGTTPFTTASLTAGQYRVSAFTQIITAASINSSVITTFSFTRNTIACTLSSAALTTNDPTKPGSFVGLITIDGGTPVSYTSAYVSNAAGMVYTTNLILERVNA